MNKRLSAAALILANLVPVAGVFVAGWRVFDILILYWIENVIVGLVNVLRMATCTAGIGGRRFERALEKVSVPRRIALGRVDAGAKFFMIPFFMLHYGAFCFAHLAAVTALFGNGEASIAPLKSLSGYLGEGVTSSPLWLAIAAILASHLLSFAANFIAGGEYRRTSLSDLMHRPYARIMILHVTIIIGGGLVQYFGSPVYLLLVLVALKTLMDLKYHLKERDVLAARGSVA